MILRMDNSSISCSFATKYLSNVGQAKIAKEYMSFLEAKNAPTVTIKVCALKYVPNNFDFCLLYFLLLLLYVCSVIYPFGWRCQLKILACSFATIIPFNPKIYEYAKCLPHSLNQKMKEKESVPHSKFLTRQKEKVIIIEKSCYTLDIAHTIYAPFKIMF